MFYNNVSRWYFELLFIFTQIQSNFYFDVSLHFVHNMQKITNLKQQ